MSGRAGVPRQFESTLDMALSEAVRMMRAQAVQYRNPRNHLDKNVRKSLAASYEDWARLIEAHAMRLASPSDGVAL